MTELIAQSLPSALGIAISPLPIIAAILMLLSAKARATSVGLLLGWALGIAVAVTLFTLLSSVLTRDGEDAPHPLRGIVQVLLGVLLLALALVRWRTRPDPGQDPALPSWMRAIDSITAPAALGLGLLLSAINPKNLLLAAGAGLSFGSARVSAGALVVVVAVFTVVAASTVLVPVVGYLLASDRLRGPLDALRVWLGRENTVIMAALLLVIGVVLIGQGIAAFRSP